MSLSNIAFARSLTILYAYGLWLCPFETPYKLSSKQYPPKKNLLISLPILCYKTNRPPGCSLMKSVISSTKLSRITKFDPFSISLLNYFKVKEGTISLAVLRATGVLKFLRWIHSPIIITNTINKQFTKMIPDSIAWRAENWYLSMIPEITAS